MSTCNVQDRLHSKYYEGDKKYINQGTCKLGEGKIHSQCIKEGDRHLNKMPRQ